MTLKAICRNHSGIPHTHYVIDDGDPRYVKLLAACGLTPDGKAFAGGCWLRDAGKDEVPERDDADIYALLTFSDQLNRRAKSGGQ